jgi:putative membrane protein
MTASQGDLASMSRFIFRAPRWYTSWSFAIVLGAIIGVGAFGIEPEGANFIIDAGPLVTLNDAFEGVFFIGIPTIIASAGTAWVDQRLGGRLSHNRASLLALLCEVVVVAFLGAGGAIALASESLGSGFVFDVLFLGLASIFALRLFVITAISRHRPVVAAIPASIQTVAAATLLFVYSGSLYFFDLSDRTLVQAFLSRPQEAPNALSYAVVPADFVLLGFICLIQAVAVVGFLYAIDRPWRANMGVSVLDFIAGFIGHIAEGSRELEDFFESVGEDAVVPVTVASFRRMDGIEKARWVLPMIHPGPMGEIGGGNLPKRVAQSADGLAFPPHATAGHDFNLVTEREVETIVDCANDAYESIDYTTHATESVRTVEGNAKVLGQAFDDDVLLVSTHSPEFADDVDYAVGLSCAAEARAGGFENVLLVDAHNCNDGLAGDDLGHVTPGSERSFDMMQASKAAAEALADADQYPLRLGTAWTNTEWGPIDGIGPLGIRAAVTEANDQLTAYVLIDGNNMEPGLRERILKALGERVEDAEVMTTDTHIVNQVEASNQVGESIDQGDLIAVIEDLVDDATADLEPVEAGMATERATVTVFGNDRTETLASHANVMVSLGGALALLVTAGTIAISLLIFLITSGTLGAVL